VACYIRSIKGENYAGSCFWDLVVDDYTDYCRSLFLKAKTDLKGMFITLLTDLKMAGLDVKFIQCDDLGEIKARFDECRSKQYNVKFEFSGLQSMFMSYYVAASQSYQQV
jgi:hypothetical protein